MATFEKPKPSQAVPLDLLPVIRESGVLTDRQFAEIKAKVLTGDYPNDSVALAERLVKEKILTEYQARRFLGNKSHGLVVGRYVILDRLGSGSMGRVYKAHHLMMDRVVAHQDHRPRDRLERAGRRPVPARDEAGRPARPPQRRPRVRRRPDQQGPLHRDGVRPGPEPRRSGSGRG